MKQPTNRGDGQNTPTDEITHVIPLGEETLKVDKRRVEGRKTTIRRIVMQRPASADIELQSETVVVEMREPVNLNDIGKVLEESTYEAQDFHEEPVVMKQPRMVQEVVVRRVKESKVETISDVVRYDEVKIEHIEPIKEEKAAVH